MGASVNIEIKITSFDCHRCRRGRMGRMSRLLNSRNSFRNREHPNLPRPTPTAHLRGTPLRPGPAPPTCPLVASPRLCDRIPRALLRHPALLPALRQQPLTRLPSAPLHPRCSREPRPRTSEERDSLPRITLSLWSLVSTRKGFYSLLMLHGMQWLQHELH